jgi:hypothetical protein
MILLPLGLAGILLYVNEVQNPILKPAWKLLAPAIVLGQFGSNLIGRYRMIKQSEVTRDEVRVADIGTAALLLPNFIINLRYAFVL